MYIVKLDGNWYAEFPTYDNAQSCVESLIFSGEVPFRGWLIEEWGNPQGQGRAETRHGVGAESRQVRREVLLQTAALPEPKDLHLAEFDGRIRLLYKNTSD